MNRRDGRKGVYRERKGTECASVKRQEGSSVTQSGFKLSEQPCKGQPGFKRHEGKGD